MSVCLLTDSELLGGVSVNVTWQPRIHRKLDAIERLPSRLGNL